MYIWTNAIFPFIYPVLGPLLPIRCIADVVSGKPSPKLRDNDVTLTLFKYTLLLVFNGSYTPTILYQTSVLIKLVAEIANCVNESLSSSLPANLISWELVTAKSILLDTSFLVST